MVYTCGMLGDNHSNSGHNGKKPLDKERRRVILSARVSPSTLEFIDSLDGENRGRALDVLVDSIKNKTLRALLEAGQIPKVTVIGG